MDGRRDGWKNGLRDVWVSLVWWEIGFKLSRLDGWMDGWIDGWMDGWMRACMKGKLIILLYCRLC